MKSNSQETRSEVIRRHLMEAMHTLRLSRESFAQSVVEHYCAVVAVSARTVDFKTEGDIFACAKTNTQRLFRMLDSEVSDTRLPVDLEESVVLSLPEEHRKACIHALAARYGLMDVPLPVPGNAGALNSLGAFTASLGNALSAIAPILADGKVDALDKPHMVLALQQLEQLEGSSSALKQRLLMELADTVTIGA